MFNENDVIASRYRLLRELGRGGMGVVWEALDEQLHRSVAVKVITPKLARDPKKLERFETGARAVAALQSPHIVQLLEYGVDTQPFMVMELLYGEVLTERIASGHRFDLPTAVRIIGQTANALAVAHEAGVVHRNLKPGNIFLVKSGADEYVKVFDFGTAKWLTGFRDANDITTMGSVMGNPDYLAPEQLSGDSRSDHRADVWSLAAIAYHLITGVTPFEGEQMGAIMRSILFTEPESPTALVPDLPPALAPFFVKALAKKRDDRFQSAQELAGALCTAAGVDRSTVSISVAASDSSIHDVAADVSTQEVHAPAAASADEPPAASSAPATSNPAPSAVQASSPPSSAVPSAARRPTVDTPARTALVRPSRPPGRIALPSLPVLLIGGLVSVAIGGAAAWITFGPGLSSIGVGPAPASSGEASSSPSGSQRRAPPTQPAKDDSSARPAPSEASSPAPSPPPGKPAPSASGSAAAGEPSASASASSSSAPPIRPQRPDPWGDPNDIYD